MTRPAPIRLRPFVAADLPQTVAIVNAAFPDLALGLDEARHREETWDHGRYLRVPIVAEGAAGIVVAVGGVSHSPEHFHPRKFGLELVVHPEHRGRGVGGALYDRLEDELCRRDTLAVAAHVQESRPESVAFLVRRGYDEADRAWESRLTIAGFEAGRFAGVAERVTEQGVALSTLDVERARDPTALDAAYRLWLACNRDRPSLDPITDIALAAFVAAEVEGPQALPDAYFLAVADGRYVGQSSLAQAADPAVLHQLLTGVLPGYRGRGIALALKLATIGYAQARGVVEIRTHNNARNGPMLRINEALGFVKQPVWLTMLKTFEPPSTDRANVSDTARPPSP